MSLIKLSFKHSICARRYSFGSKQGIALLLVVSILTVVAIIGVSFAFSMYLETQSAGQFASGSRARFLAEAGVSHARAMLDEDKIASLTDDLNEKWTSQFSGVDVGVEDSGKSDARWWKMEDSSGNLIGSYAVVVKDEAGKVNLNTAVSKPHLYDSNMPDLGAFLSAMGIKNPDSVSDSIEKYLYGKDEKPGVASVDDDRDGAVDETGEYSSSFLNGDDRRIESLEELLGVGGLDSDDIRLLERYATVYSWDLNFSMKGVQRTNINTATADELLAMLIGIGGSDPWQTACNMADYADSDLDISRISKIAMKYQIPNQGDRGDWKWQEAPYPGYVTDTANGEALGWVLSIPSGKFHVLIHGIPDKKVGDVDINGLIKRGIDSGDSFGTLESNGSATVRVTCSESGQASCALSAIEIASLDDTSNLPSISVRGIEAVRINEVMASPIIELDVSDAVFDPQTSGWVCQGGSGACSNSETGQARWSWTNYNVPPGKYYARLFAAAAGQTVGEVKISGISSMLVHGERHPETISVGNDQKISITVGKTAETGTYRFKKLSLSLAPDAEYLEFINLSEKDINASGWVIEGSATQGRSAKLPAGSVIPSHGFLVAAVDLDDSQSGIDGNGISARLSWEIAESVRSVQLEFSSGDLNPEVDWIPANLPPGVDPVLRLRANEWVVDEIEYLLPLSSSVPFQSMEKADPSIVQDSNGNGIDDLWYPALSLFSPGLKNDNEGMRELQGLQYVLHDPSVEINVLNRPLESVGELAGLPSGRKWSSLSSSDLAKFVDMVTVSGISLEAEGRLVSEAGGWHETSQGYETNDQGSTATFEWTGIPGGDYRFRLYARPAEELSVRWMINEEPMGDWIPTRLSDVQGRVIVGNIKIGFMEGSPGKLTVQVRCDSPSGICHLDKICLDPQLILDGLININTALPETLRVLPGMNDEIVDRVISGRPYGDKESKKRGIGDLLIGNWLGNSEEDKLERFKRLAHLICVRSNVFSIMSLGKSSEKSHKGASKKVNAVVQRYP